MARYRITGPDGAAYDITAPDGASEEEVMTFAASQMSSLANPTRTPLQQPASQSEALPQGAERFAAPQMAGSLDSMNMSAADVASQAVRNLPASATQFAKDVVQPFFDPVGTFNSLTDIGGGLVSKAAGAFGVQQDPEDKARREASADAVGQFFKDRYGNVAALKNTLATDPVGALGDLSAALTGAALPLRATGLTAKAGRAIQRTANAIDPLQAAARTARATGGGVANILGVTTGAGDAPIREAYKAGRAGGDTGAAFMSGMRDPDMIDQSVASARSALGQMRAERGAAYRAGRDVFTAVDEPVAVLPAYQAVENARDGIRATNAAGDVVAKIDPAAESALKKIASKIREFDELSGPYGLSVEHADGLKRAIGIIRDQIPDTQRNAFRVADDVYKSVDASIRKQAPTYAATMKGYSTATDAINEIERTLSLKNQATKDTAARKLQSVMRNNVNTNYGQRAKLVDELAKFEPELKPSLAGQALNSWMPRGLARITPASVATTGAATFNPSVLAMLPATSPKLAGYGAYAAGAATRPVDALVAAMTKAKAPPDRIARVVILSQALGRLTDQAEPQERRAEIARALMAGMANATTQRAGQ